MQALEADIAAAKPGQALCDQVDLWRYGPSAGLAVL
jgi:hypothetical protein